MSRETGWQRVTRKAPCAVCGSPTFCSRTRDGALLQCMREPTWRGKPCDFTRATDLGEAYFYRLIDEPMPDMRRRQPEPPAPRDLRPVQAVWRDLAGKRASQECKALLRVYSATLGYHSETLWLSGASLAAGPKLAWPMFDGAGNVVGIRYRTPVDRGASKYAQTGSDGNGLFVPPMQRDGRYLAIVEGPTDMAAAMQLGVPVIGRPSCSGGIEYVQAYLAANPTYSPVIIGDMDKPKHRNDGSIWRPGVEGAAKLSAAITAPVVFPPEDVNDLRGWMRYGLTRKKLEAVLRNA